MGGYLSSAASAGPSKQSIPPESSAMSNLVIPVVLEKNFALRDGSTEGGFPVAISLQLNENRVDNLYVASDGQFKFSFQEHGVAYNETEATDFRVEASLPISAGNPTGFTMKVDQTPVEMWGVNFAARILVNHVNSGKERVIYIPGTRTYDPAGLTGKSPVLSCMGKCFFCRKCVTCHSHVHTLCSRYSTAALCPSVEWF